MKKLLKEVTSIQSGIYSRPVLGGNIRYLQTRHFEGDHSFNPTVKSNIDVVEKMNRHILRNGDILMAVKGHDHFAVMYTEDMGPAVASTVFIVIRPSVSDILSEYLTWFLNHPRVQFLLEVASKGSNLPSITIGDLEKIEIPIPPIAIQKRVVQLDKLREQEIGIMRRLEELREKSLQHMVLTAINKL